MKKMSKKQETLSYMSLIARLEAAKKESLVNSPEEVGVERKRTSSSLLDKVPNFKETSKKRQVTVYIDEDLAKKLDKFGEEKGKGAKSELANMLFKNALTGYGE
ncbi:hypothetical protein NLX67_20585 [Domibacillus sp. A3M-37]|uniref:hypothetical protein n=1 Tax=Domibacillus sp. A3M-37 TaxID=2962037 RepID=UPI0020B7FC90|nr:hypothetical protein [Domibacillus sp. A3M-37]MCP3764734.1 hypothetical protein [Domibacillus sp. A3M-37]